MTTFRIAPTRGLGLAGLRQAWEKRELFFFFVWRDIKVRYKQTLLGALWAVIQPAALMVLFAIIYRAANLPTDGIPPALFAYTGLVVWVLFAQSMSAASNSLVAEINIVSKVYFPRIILPVAGSGSHILDFGISILLLLGLLMFYRIEVSARILLAIPFALLGALAALAVGMFLSAVNVKYRDVRYALPFLTQLWLFASPVLVPTNRLPLPEGLKAFYGLNPMAGVIEGFRWAVLGTSDPPWQVIYVSSAAIFVYLLMAVAYFNRSERKFADII